MARIAGVDIPRNKQVGTSLTYIYGIGPSASKNILAEADAEHVSFYAYFTETLLHEISHVFGSNYITMEDGTETTVRKALADKYSPIE